MLTRKIVRLLLCFLMLAVFTGNAIGETAEGTEAAIPVKVLILPKFEISEMAGDFPGEAQYYYERYLDGAETYEIAGGTEGNLLYVKDGVALYMLGMGKVNSALNTMAVLSDRRFDFSGAYILSTGCAGSSAGNTVMGDVFIITAAVDYDLGHHADIREMTQEKDVTWFHDSDFDSGAYVLLDPELTDKVWALTENVPVETTPVTREYMRAAFDGEEWAVRDPKVIRGTSVTADNYWKGEYGHANALEMVREYGCPDPYVATEMEDVAVCLAVKRMGMLDRLIIVRDSVNMDVFLLGATPEVLWGEGISEKERAEDEGSNVETADIFATAMKNNFAVGSVIIDAILAGDF